MQCYLDNWKKRVYIWCTSRDPYVYTSSVPAGVREGHCFKFVMAVHQGGPLYIAPLLPTAGFTPVRVYLVRQGQFTQCCSGYPLGWHTPSPCHGDGSK